MSKEKGSNLLDGPPVVREGVFGFLGHFGIGAVVPHGYEAGVPGVMARTLGLTDGTLHPTLKQENVLVPGTTCFDVRAKYIFMHNQIFVTLLCSLLLPKMFQKLPSFSEATHPTKIQFGCDRKILP